VRQEERKEEEDEEEQEKKKKTNVEVIPHVVQFLYELLEVAEGFLYRSHGLFLHQHVVMPQEILQIMLQSHVLFFHLPALHSLAAELL
jgi:hypothetical protein